MKPNALFSRPVRPRRSGRLIVGLALASATASFSLWSQTFTGEGNWKDDARWDTGVPADGATAIVNGICEISENIGDQNTINPGRIIVGQGTSGTLNVTGGTLSGAHGGSSGIFVGEGAGGVGEVFIAEGAALRSQGGGMVVRVGDDQGGVGTVVVAGELLNYKFFEIINGTLEMRPTGINNKFNSTDPSLIGDNGTLSYVIDGANVGALERANDNGINVTISSLANLKITLSGVFNVGDSWTLMKYTTLFGTFAQGYSFTNEQGYTFDIDYGVGSSDELTITLTSTASRPQINSFTAAPAAVASGGTSTLAWSVSAFDSLTIDQGVGDVSANTTGGSGSVEVSPTETTTYTLTLRNGAVTVEETVTVVVEEAPIIGLYAATETLLAPGGSTVLQWKVDGAETLTISGLGNVAASGEQTLFPAETTTYVLTGENAYGTATAEITVIVDAILASLINQYDASLPGNTSGFWKDSVGVNNFDMKSNELLTDIQSFTTRLTAANHMISFTADTGGDALGFPGGSTTYEIWARPGTLDAGHQVLFETGGGSNGRCILMTQSEVRFLDSSADVQTHDLVVPLAGISTGDFIQIVAVMDDAIGRVTLYVNGSAGGQASAVSDGPLGTPNGRSTVFSWSSFAAGIAGALGGSAGVEPDGTTQFRGEIALINVFGRTLSADEVQTQFERYAIPDPGLINSFTATPERVTSGGTVTLAWDVGEYDSLTILEIGDVSGNTTDGIGSIDVTVDEITVFTLVASNSEGSSVAQTTVLTDVPAGAILLMRNASSWEDADVWSDGQPAHGGAPYFVLDYYASSLGTPDTSSPSFPGTSLELRGADTSLLLQQGSGSSAQFADLRLAGATVVHTIEGDVLGVTGKITAVDDSTLDVTGAAKILNLEAGVEGEGMLTVAMTGDPETTASSVNINAANPDFSGGWTFSGGNTYAMLQDGLGSGDINIINGALQPAYGVNNPDATLSLQGATSLYYVLGPTTFGAMNIIQGNGLSLIVPPGSYDVTSWGNFLAAQQLPADAYLQFWSGDTVTVLGENPAPLAGTTFTGEGNWLDVERWSEGLPADGSVAVINGTAEVTEDHLGNQDQNPGTVFIGAYTAGTVNVTGGGLNGAHGGGLNGGLYVGVGPGGMGSLDIAEGATYRTQGGSMRLKIGDEQGGVGDVRVAGELQVYKFFELINGTLEMLPTGLNQMFNSGDPSRIGPNGTLAFVIDGAQVGGLIRANTSGLVLDIDPAATLKVTLGGNVSVNDTWTLIDYTTLTGQFAQGTGFTNEQGHTFTVDYGTGDNSVVTLQVVELNPDSTPPTLSITRGAGSVTIDFTGRLESATQVQGPYSEVAGATSPHSAATTDAARFYRAAR